MPSSHKPHPLITGTILLTAAGLLSRVLGFFSPDLSLPHDRRRRSRDLSDDLSGLRDLFLLVRRLDPDCDLPFHRSGAGTCEADACFRISPFLFHVTLRGPYDPTFFRISRGICPHGTAVRPAALRHGLCNPLHFRPCLYLRLLLRKGKGVCPCSPPSSLNR